MSRLHAIFDGRSQSIGGALPHAGISHRQSDPSPCGSVHADFTELRAIEMSHVDNRTYHERIVQNTTLNSDIRCGQIGDSFVDGSGTGLA